MVRACFPYMVDLSPLQRLKVYIAPENIYTHPKEGSWKFQGGVGEGAQKPNFFI